MTEEVKMPVVYSLRRTRGKGYKRDLRLDEEDEWMAEFVSGIERKLGRRLTDEERGAITIHIWFRLVI